MVWIPHCNLPPLLFLQVFCLNCSLQKEQFHFLCRLVTGHVLMEVNTWISRTGTTQNNANVLVSFISENPCLLCILHMDTCWQWDNWQAKICHPSESRLLLSKYLFYLFMAWERSMVTQSPEVVKLLLALWLAEGTELHWTHHRGIPNFPFFASFTFFCIGNWHLFEETPPKKPLHLFDN